MAIKSTNKVTLEIEEGEELKAFSLTVKSPTKKEQKEFKKFVKEQSKENEKLDKAMKSYASKKREVDALRDEIADITALLSSDIDAEERVALLRENIAKKRTLKPLVEDLDSLEKSLNDYDNQFADMQENTKRKIYSMQVVADDGLSAYIEESGIGYDVVLAEIVELTQEAQKKKKR